LSTEPVITESPEIIEAPIVEAPAEEAAVVETESAEDTEAEGDKEAPERDEKGRFKGDGVQKRIDELTRARREAERQVEYWRGVATQTAPAIGTDKPVKADYADDDAYIEAVAEWTAVQAVTKVQQAQAAQAETGARMAAWEAREAETKAAIPDYDEVVSGSTAPVKQHVVDVLMESESGPALVYHLAKNADVVERLNGLSPARAAIELGRLEATLTAPAVKQPSNAPAPITPITSQSSGRNIDLAKASMEEYIAERRRQGARF
jgi:hypothetical protein